MESRLFEEVGRGWADTAHATELQLACPRMVSIFCSVVRIGRSGRGMGRYGPHYRTTALSEPRSFLRIVRLFAAKPGPARFRSEEERLPRIARRTRRGEGTGSENLLLSGHRAR